MEHPQGRPHLAPPDKQKIGILCPLYKVVVVMTGFVNPV